MLSKDDVVSVASNESFVDRSPTFTVGEAVAFLTDRIDDDLADWGKDGVPCRVLSASGGGWQKGKIKISLEFIPED
jgi:hypothetical protein